MIVTHNIAYVEGDTADPRHQLDVYAPATSATDAPWPVLMFISGGGWNSGSKDWIANIGRGLSERGIGVVTVDHRLAPDVQYFGQVEDLARAFAWVKANIANHGGNLEQVVVGGHSAGSHLITMMVMDEQYLQAVDLSSDDVAGVIPMSGIMRLGSQFIGSDAVVPDNDEARAAASPINLVQEGLPPFLLIYADDDFLNVIRDAEDMQVALVDLGVDAIRAEIPERDHFTVAQQIGVPNDPATQVLVEWITELFED